MNTKQQKNNITDKSITLNFDDVTIVKYLYQRYPDIFSSPVIKNIFYEPINIFKYYNKAMKNTQILKWYNQSKNTNLDYKVVLDKITDLVFEQFWDKYENAIEVVSDNKIKIENGTWPSGEIRKDEKNVKYIDTSLYRLKQFFIFFYSQQIENYKLLSPNSNVYKKWYELIYEDKTIDNINWDSTLNLKYNLNNAKSYFRDLFKANLDMWYTSVGIKKDNTVDINQNQLSEMFYLNLLLTFSYDNNVKKQLEQEKNKNNNSIVKFKIKRVADYLYQPKFSKGIYQNNNDKGKYIYLYQRIRDNLDYVTTELKPHLDNYVTHLLEQQLNKDARDKIEYLAQFSLFN